MIRRRLSLQLALVFVLVSFVPLVGAGVVTVLLLERSITDQVRRSQDQLAVAASALVRDYLTDATTKLKSIAHMLDEKQDPKVQTDRLNKLIDPPDIFLEVGYWTVDTRAPMVRAQVQQELYRSTQDAAQRSGPPPQAPSRTDYGSNNRTLNTDLGQYVLNWTKDDPIVAEPRKGNAYLSHALETVGEFPALPISVPAPGGAILTASLDFRPVSQMLAKIAGERYEIALTSTDTKAMRSSILAASGPPGGRPGIPLVYFRELGHANWSIQVSEPRELALAPLRKAMSVAGVALSIGLLLVAAGTAYFGRRVFRPLLALAQTADTLGRGDFSARTGIERPDEIGQLAKAFDRMAGAVQELDRMKGEFVAHVSHELRTPLTSAKVAIANVQEGLAGKDALGRVQQDLDRLVRMVNELLDAARIEAGIALAKQPTDLAELVRSAVESLRPIARVPLEVTGSGSTIDIDPARVQQIVVNLVDNALKYAKGRVEVKVEGREVRVTDDGLGVPPEQRERIFERFAKVETGPKPPGAGLGLSIARKLAELHGGTLACEGNTFVLKL